MRVWCNGSTRASKPLSLRSIRSTRAKFRVNMPTKEWLALNQERMRKYRRDWYKRNAEEERAKARDRKKAFLGARRAVLGETCEICGSSQKLCWDHCHTTGNFRGTLCSTCNAGLGMFKESIDSLMSAVTYLKERQPR